MYLNFLDVIFYLHFIGRFNSSILLFYLLTDFLFLKFRLFYFFPADLQPQQFSLCRTISRGDAEYLQEISNNPDLSSRNRVSVSPRLRGKKSQNGNCCLHLP